jgi:hypothetical protein
MNVFAKIFAQIFDSSIAADYVVRHVFMDMLVLADRDGVVDMTLDAISRRTNVPEQMVAHAIAELMKDDRSSRSHEEDGRRLIPIDSHRDWGWQIVNYEHYRNIRDEEARRTYFRDKQREQRAKSKPKVKRQTLSNSVKDNTTVSKKVTQGEADIDTEVQKPSRAKRERATKTAIADERHTAFKEAIRRYWDSKNTGVEMPWGPAEGKQLGMWLREAPHVTLEQFTGFLRNRYKSDVNHGERPCQWLKWITSYGPGPVDRFKNTAQEEGNGANHPKGSGERISPAKERVNANRQVLAEIAIERGWYVPPGAAQSDGEEVSEPGLDGRAAGIHEGLGKAGPEILPPRR